MRETTKYFVSYTYLNRSGVQGYGNAVSEWKDMVNLHDKESIVELSNSLSSELKLPREFFVILNIVKLPI